MRLTTESDARRYVEGELDRVARATPGWCAYNLETESLPETSGALPQLTWRIEKTNEVSWFTLEARLKGQEFLIWFGNHQVGAHGLHWMMRPAVHLSFEDLKPRDDLVALRFTLGDVLAAMIRSSESPRPTFPTNSFSNT